MPSRLVLPLFLSALLSFSLSTPSTAAACTRSFAMPCLSPHHASPLTAAAFGVAQLAFRRLTRRHRTDISFTPMIVASSFVASSKARAADFTTASDDSPLVRPCPALLSSLLPFPLSITFC